MATFMFKVGTLALKTLAKPLADRFKGYVMTHPRGREAALALAQRLHRVEVTVARRADGKEGRAFIGEMTEERGVELASKLASEGFVFAVGAGLVGLEYERNRRKDEAKKRDELAARRRAAAVAEAEREALRLVNERQEQRLAELATRLLAVEAAVGDVVGEIRRAATEAAVGFPSQGAAAAAAGEAAGATTAAAASPSSSLPSVDTPEKSAAAASPAAATAAGAGAGAAGAAAAGGGGGAAPAAASAPAAPGG
jgi:optic atrophy 3 protein